MNIISLMVVLVVVGLLLWLVNNYIPMEGRIKQIPNEAPPQTNESWWR
jgi:hypothetical protein